MFKAVFLDVEESNCHIYLQTNIPCHGNPFFESSRQQMGL